MESHPHCAIQTSTELEIPKPLPFDLIGTRCGTLTIDELDVIEQINASDSVGLSAPYLITE